MKFEQQQLDLLHPTMTLFGTGENYGRIFVKDRALPLPSYQWTEYKEIEGGARVEICARGSAYLAALDLEPKKPRAPRTKK